MTQPDITPNPAIIDPGDARAMADAAKTIKEWAAELGFQGIGITDTELEQDGQHLQHWLDNDYHGDMDWMAKHGTKRFRPAELVTGTCRIISVRMDYAPAPDSPAAVLKNREKAYISRYTLGRDYHKLLRKRLAQLAQRIDEMLQGYDYRAFVDSAPVLERAVARKAGLGWTGKNTMLLNRKAGSFFFLGEIFTSAPLPLDEPYNGSHCGSCSKCLDLCPTDAFVGAGTLDARRCISYLTIENSGPIPLEFRKAMGNRVFGCDDCQLVCPWNRFSKPASEPDFQPRHSLDNSDLASLFRWDEQTFLERTAGSAIRRTGFEGWLRNLAVALGNAPSTIPVLEALRSREEDPSALVREHVQWALAQHEN
ncbi:tRNA epoxyqueuosine(34) reductase QueG [Hydrocarboniclastica marina]|nr:tRNA epoxyqueuosine(34) reductase QueG [Hydrocarboniclastica marina]